MHGGDGRGVLGRCVRGGGGQVAANRPEWRSPSPWDPTKTVLLKLSCILDCSFKMPFHSVSSLICPFSSIRSPCNWFILVHLEQIKAPSVKY